MGKQDDEHQIESEIYAVNYIPPFLKPHIGDTTRNTLHVASFQMAGNEGFMVDLNGFHDIDGYIKEKMGRKSRNIKRSIRKLETCFEINYKFYFGHISKEVYDLLFLKLYSLLDRRFKQKGAKNELFNNWEFLVESTFEMIINKMASIFVVYDNKKPIVISLSYHYQNTYHNAVCAYNIDYDRFSLGQVGIFKQIEWCLENDFQLFDLGPGDLRHKRLWCNVVYDFEHQLICSKTNLLSRVTVSSLVYYYRSKAFLKKKNLHKVYYYMRKLFKKRKEQGIKYIGPRFEILPQKSYPKDADLTLLNLEHEDTSFLRKPVFDFQFSNSEASKDVKIYGVDQEEHVYLIKGKSSVQWLKVIKWIDPKK
nr:GNAT family N-acetyltransferase [uncultured Allomuricauda sp.]